MNVPIDLDESLKTLPRHVNQCEQIHLNWMRKMAYTRPYMQDCIRPSAIYRAIKYLNNIPGGAYQQADISIEQEHEWRVEVSEEIAQSSQSETILVTDIVDEIEPQLSTLPTIDRILAEELRFKSVYSMGALKALTRPAVANARSPASSFSISQSSQSSNDIEDEDTDEYFDIDPENVGQQTVVLNEQDYAQNVSLAPAAYQRPISLAFDTYGEELTFLKIYGGELRDHQLYKSCHISYSSLCKSEFRRFDRRCAENPSKLFYSYRKLIQLNLASSINISMRKMRKAMKLKRRDALNTEFMRDLLFKNEAQLLFRNIRSSPSYWDARKKDINAMIRTLGSPTLFITLSPAEIMWPELIRLLIRVLAKPEDNNSGFNSYDRMTDEQLLALPKEKLYALISKDPITVARYFDHRFACLRNYLFDKHGGPFKEHPIVDYDYRIEFQHKGSPHAHMLVWNRGAPQFDKYEFITRDHRLTCEDGYGAVNFTPIKSQSSPADSFDESEETEQVTESQLQRQMSQQFRSEKMQLCLQFVDKYISCARPPGDLVISDAFGNDAAAADKHEKYDKTCHIQLQIHSHRANCRVIEMPDNYRGCKYGFPKPLMQQTMILEPLPQSFDSERLAFYVDKWRSIREKLVEISKLGDKSKIKTLDELLRKMRISQDEYLMSIRASIKTITVFLRRQYNELMINNYMPEVYVRHRGNMDIQYVTDAYGAAVYVSAYMLKSNAVMSVLLKRAIFDINRGVMSLRSKFNAVASKFSNSNEISAQECAYQILSMRVSKASRQVLFVNTMPPDERYGMLKERAQLEAQKSDSPFCPTLLDYYVARPDSMESMCLAEFAANYDYLSITRYNLLVKDKMPRSSQYAAVYNENENADQEKESSQQSSDDDDEEDGDEEDERAGTNKGALDQADKYVKLKKNLGYMRKRASTPKILRSRRYNVNKDPANYAREQIMLYMPWRSEEEELFGDAQNYFKHHTALIRVNRLPYEHTSTEDFELACEYFDQQLQDQYEETNERERLRFNRANELATRNPHSSQSQSNTSQEQRDQEEAELAYGFQANADVDDETYSRDYGGKRLDVDLEEDGNDSGYGDGDDFYASRLNEEEYDELMTQLNNRQHCFLMNIVSRIKNNERFHVFVSGCGGTGKSMLIKALTETANRLYNLLDPNLTVERYEKRTILCAFTAKAAFLINGLTIHSSFHLQLQPKRNANDGSHPVWRFECGLADGIPLHQPHHHR